MSTPRTQHVYNNRRWKAVRRYAIIRADYQCELHLPGCTGRATQGDHIAELEDGGARYDPANVQAACRHCNVAKGNQRRLDRLAGKIHAPSRTW